MGFIWTHDYLCFLHSPDCRCAFEPNCILRVLRALRGKSLVSVPRELELESIFPLPLPQAGGTAKNLISRPLATVARPYPCVMQVTRV